MIVAYLAPGNSIHVVKIVNEMVERGHEIHLITIHQPIDIIDSRVIIHNLAQKAPMGYYLNTGRVKDILKSIKPQVLNTHYASGYGTLSRLTGFYPTLLSVWGSDVFDFPEKSFIHRRIIERNLAAADMIASTSNIMKEQTLKYVKPKRDIEVTPFGVNVESFKPMDTAKSEGAIRIGMVKALQEKYGVGYFIKAIRLLIDMLVDNGCEELAERIEVPIVGDGYMKGKYIQLSRQLKLESKVNFLGWLPHEKIPYILNTLDIYCAPSILDSESFGVAVIEASACGIPVVVSRIGGLPEVIIDGTTGFLTNPMDEKDIAEYLYKLVIDEGLRKTMGKSGREFVIKNYEWKENAGRLEKIYCSMI